MAPVQDDPTDSSGLDALISLLDNRGTHDGGTQEEIDLTDDTDDDDSQPEIEVVADVECRMMLMVEEAMGGIRVNNLLQPVSDLADLVTQQPSISMKQFLNGQVEKRNLFAHNIATPNVGNASQVTQVVILGVILKKRQTQRSFRSGRAFFRMTLGTPGGGEAIDVLVCRDAYCQFTVDNCKAGKVVAVVRPSLGTLAPGERTTFFVTQKKQLILVGTAKYYGICKAIVDSKLTKKGRLLKYCNSTFDSSKGRFCPACVTVFTALPRMVQSKRKASGVYTRQKQSNPAIPATRGGTFIPTEPILSQMLGAKVGRNQRTFVQAPNPRLAQNKILGPLPR
jgi:hypothetical protein